MAEITTSTTLQELAAVVSQALVAGGVEATLSGGAAVSIYTDNRYQSKDLDFVSSAAHRTLAALICPLGFTETPSKRLFSHSQVEWLLEFPPGPLGFGARVVDSSKLESIDTPWGQLRVIPPTLCVMDRLAAYLHWRDRQCWQQAVWVAQCREIDWEDLRSWSCQEGLSEQDWLLFQRSVGEDIS